MSFLLPQTQTHTPLPCHLFTLSLFPLLFSSEVNVESHLNSFLPLDLSLSNPLPVSFHFFYSLSLSLLLTLSLAKQFFTEKHFPRTGTDTLLLLFDPVSHLLHFLPSKFTLALTYSFFLTSSFSFHSQAFHFIENVYEHITETFASSLEEM